MQSGGIAAPVQEQNDLLASFEALSDGLLELRREDRDCASWAQGLAHVHDAHDRHFLVVGALQQLQQFVLAPGAVVKTLHRGSGRAEHDRGAFHLATDDGDVSGMVAGRFFLLVSVLVLFIHDDQAERFDRREDCRTRPDDNAGAAPANLVPFIVALACGQVAVQDGDQGLKPAGGEPGFEPFNRLRRK